MPDGQLWGLGAPEEALKEVAVTVDHEAATVYRRVKLSRVMEKRVESPGIGTDHRVGWAVLTAAHLERRVVDPCRPHTAVEFEVDRRPPTRTVRPHRV